MIFAPIAGVIAGASWYVKRVLPAYMAEYFNVPAARVSAQVSLRHAEHLRDYLSYPLGLPQYVSAQMTSLTAHTKLSMLEMFSAFTAGLFNGLLSVLAILLCVYVFFKMMKYHKTRSAESRAAYLVVNKLLPVLDEMNRNILEVKERIAVLEAERKSPE